MAEEETLDLTWPGIGATLEAELRGMKDAAVAEIKDTFKKLKETWAHTTMTVQNAVCEAAKWVTPALTYTYTLKPKSQAGKEHKTPVSLQIGTKSVLATLERTAKVTVKAKYKKSILADHMSLDIADRAVKAEAKVALFGTELKAEASVSVKKEEVKLSASVELERNKYSATLGGELNSKEGASTSYGYSMPITSDPKEAESKGLLESMDEASHRLGGEVLPRLAEGGVAAKQATEVSAPAPASLGSGSVKYKVELEFENPKPISQGPFELTLSGTLVHELSVPATEFLRASAEEVYAWISGHTWAVIILAGVAAGVVVVTLPLDAVVGALVATGVAIAEGIVMVLTISRAASGAAMVSCAFKQAALAP